MGNETQTPQEVIEAAESEIPTEKEAQEAEGKTTYGAEKVDEILKKYQDRNREKYSGKKEYEENDLLNYSDGNLIDGLLDGAKVKKEDSRSALASLDSTGIQKLREIAKASQERNPDQDPNNSNATKLEKLAQQAEQLASLSSEEGQKKFIQDITQSLKFGEVLNRGTINKLDATFSLLQKNDKETKKIIFDEIKPVLLETAKESTSPVDAEIADRIIKEYQD